MSFFGDKKAAAILKHAVIDKYIDPFAGKTGKYSPDHRVAVIDGYAGAGEYASGDEASPRLLMRKAAKLAGMNRRLECYFVEEDPATFAKLEQVVKSQGADLPIHLFQGKIGDHLGHVLTRVEGVPTLVFLDPFGLMIPFAHAVSIFAQRPNQRPATELLINFNVTGLRRIAGLLTSETPVAASLARMDEGIFLAPMIARREPRHQASSRSRSLERWRWWSSGTPIGSYLGVHGVLKDAASNWFGLQGFEYLDLARLWQVLLSVGLFVWVFMLWRVLRGRLATEHRGNMPWLFFLAACAIPAFYAVG